MLWSPCTSSCNLVSSNSKSFTFRSCQRSFSCGGLSHPYLFADVYFFFKANWEQAFCHSPLAGTCLHDPVGLELLDPLLGPLFWGQDRCHCLVWTNISWRTYKYSLPRVLWVVAKSTGTTRLRDFRVLCPGCMKECVLDSSVKSQLLLPCFSNCFFPCFQFRCPLTHAC